LVAECVKHFESSAVVHESLDGFRYLTIKKKPRLPRVIFNSQLVLSAIFSAALDHSLVSRSKSQARANCQ
jgi:hypothetical protein